MIISPESVQSALLRGRAAAETRMSETVIIGRFVDGIDPTTGDATRVPAETHYEGKARIKYPSLALTDRAEPSQAIAAQEPLVSIPTGSPAIPPGDEVQVTASTVDALLVGRQYRIEGAPQSGQTTSHRYPIKQLS